jgi:hypothetical protein
VPRSGVLDPRPSTYLGVVKLFGHNVAVVGIVWSRVTAMFVSKNSNIYHVTIFHMTFNNTYFCYIQADFLADQTNNMVKS